MLGPASRAACSPQLRRGVLDRAGTKPAPGRAAAHLPRRCVPCSICSMACLPCPVWLCPSRARDSGSKQAKQGKQASQANRTVWPQATVGSKGTRGTRRCRGKGAQEASSLLDSGCQTSQTSQRAALSPPCSHAPASSSRRPRRGPRTRVGREASWPRAKEGPRWLLGRAPREASRPAHSRDRLAVLVAARGGWGGGGVGVLQVPVLLSGLRLSHCIGTPAAIAGHVREHYRLQTLVPAWPCKPCSGCNSPGRPCAACAHSHARTHTHTHTQGCGHYGLVPRVMHGLVHRVRHGGPRSIRDAADDKVRTRAASLSPPRRR